MFKIAKAGWQACLESTHQHPRLQKMRRDPILTQGERYFAGQQPDNEDVMDFKEFVGELRFGWICERPAEAVHEQVCMPLSFPAAD